MRNRDAIYLVLTLFSRISITVAAPPMRPAVLVASISLSLGLTRPLAHETNITSFPPGPPPPSIDYQIPGSDLSIELSSLGLVRGRDESLVERVLNDAFQASLMPFRPDEPMDDKGYKLYEGGFVLGVTPSAPAARQPFEKPLTWGMWTECLAGIQGYVEAYPGYDFAFDIWLTPPVGRSVGGYVIGAGFGFTRGQGTM